MSSSIASSINPTPRPTVDIDAIRTSAVLSAIALFTQTALAFSPTPSITSTTFPLPTATMPPTFTSTATLVPIQPQIIPTNQSVGRSGNCDPSYPDVCLKDGIGDYDCAGGTGNGPNYVKGPIRVLPPDPFGLDRDGNGIGCQ